MMIVIKKNNDNNWFPPQTGVPHYDYHHYHFQTGVPHYEDFISKAGKLHGHLK